MIGRNASGELSLPVRLSAAAVLGLGGVSLPVVLGGCTHEAGPTQWPAYDPNTDPRQHPSPTESALPYADDTYSPDTATTEDTPTPSDTPAPSRSVATPPPAGPAWPNGDRDVQQSLTPGQRLALTDETCQSRAGRGQYVLQKKPDGHYRMLVVADNRTPDNCNTGRKVSLDNLPTADPKKSHVTSSVFDGTVLAVDAYANTDNVCTPNGRDSLWLHVSYPDGNGKTHAGWVSNTDVGFVQQQAFDGYGIGEQSFNGLVNPDC